MGNPEAERDIFAWLDEALATLPLELHGRSFGTHKAT